MTTVLAGGTPQLLDPTLEISDEVRDVEIFKAVYNSMKEWERKKKFRQKYGRIKREDSSTVCYADLGCFEASGPFSYLEMLPSTPEEISTKFHLYPSHRKRRSGMIPAEFAFRNLTEAFEWAGKGFNSSLPTKVMIHGFGSDCTHVWVYEMRSALMAVEEMNLICVDWANGATLPNYVKASANTRLVGKQLSMLLKGLIQKNGISAKKLHLIGFSLGAHVAGFAGAELGNLSRITGLDPAGPLFESQDPRARLDQTDAEFVDVIHSNGENLILGGLGSWQPMGHVDFYPNGGRMQKGCSNLFVGAFTDIIWSSPVEGRSLCNHRRAYKFFTDSVSPRCHFPAFPCENYEDFLGGNCFPCTDNTNCGNMGYYADRSKGRGQLYLITRDEEPFCAHQYLIKIESSPSEVPIISYGKLQVTLIGDSLLNETFTMTKKDDEEMRLGATMSKIIVPHPILLEPAQIQIHYTAYSGWLSSGLFQWKIDKISISDSYGKSHSVCKKNLILESGAPVILPLYPGDCNLPKEAQDRRDPIEKSKLSNRNKNSTKDRNNDKNISFFPTPVVKIGEEVIKDKGNKNYPTYNDNKDKYSNDVKFPKDVITFRDAIEIFNLPWGGDKDNRLDEESAESSRAFNTRVVVIPSKNSSENQSEIIREVMEPILKPHSTKHGRSHNPDKDKPEISEPILGPTTNRNLNSGKPKAKSNFAKSSDLDFQTDKKWKRQDDQNVFTSQTLKIQSESPDHEKGFNVIVKTVQFLPQRLARMFEEAEKYARETILPLVSTYTPKFISDFIAPTDRTNKYLPLVFEEVKTTTAKSTEVLKNSSGVSESKFGEADDVNNKEKEEEIIKARVMNNLKKMSVLDDLTTESSGVHSTNAGTPFTNIQRIATSKKPEKISVVYPDSSTETFSNKIGGEGESEEMGRSVKDFVTPAMYQQLVHSSTTSEKPTTEENTSEENSKQRRKVYIDLPVFEESYPAIKYIPLNPEGEDKKIY